MTTKSSPPEQLRAQAHRIASTLKAAARGEKLAVNDPLGKIEASKAKGQIDFAIVMDDKIHTALLIGDYLASSQASHRGDKSHKAVSPPQPSPQP